MSDVKQATFVDKSTWARGPWDSEPDRLEWRMPECPGFACLIVRGPTGALCGYLGVPPGHPAHGVDWQELDVSVHGGLSFSAPCQTGEGEHGPDGLICHVPQPGESDDVWWLGFDCAHAGDVSPGRDARLAARGLKTPMTDDAWWHETYKDIGYVAKEVEDLARQLRDQVVVIEIAIP